MRITPEDFIGYGLGCVLIACGIALLLTVGFALVFVLQIGRFLGG